MRDASPSPEQARREYWKFRKRELSKIHSDYSLLSVGIPGAIGHLRAQDVLKGVVKFEKLIHIILANKDKIYISKQVMENLLEDAAWLEKVRAEAEAVLNS